MKLVLTILSVLLLVVPRGMTQEWGYDLDLSVFESEKEKELFLQDNTNVFHLFRAVHADEEGDMKAYEKLLNQLDKRSKNKDHQEWFLEQVFYKTHKILLKDYKKHSTFNDLLEKGMYDCVSASAMYALLLERFGFEYELIETDYHVFLIVKAGGKSYIFESTEPRGGFIKDQEMVKDYILSFLPEESYTSKPDQSLGGLSAHKGQKNTIYKSITLLELAGLQYYNDAIHHFNENALEVSRNQLVKAKLLYPAGRIEAFEELVVKMGDSQKELARR